MHWQLLPSVGFFSQCHKFIRSGYKRFNTGNGILGFMAMRRGGPFPHILPHLMPVFSSKSSLPCCGLVVPSTPFLLPTCLVCSVFGCSLPHGRSPTLSFPSSPLPTQIPSAAAASNTDHCAACFRECNEILECANEVPSTRSASLLSLCPKSVTLAFTSFGLDLLAEAPRSSHLIQSIGGRPGSMASNSGRCVAEGALTRQSATFGSAPLVRPLYAYPSWN